MRSVDRAEVNELLATGGVAVEVLEARQYRLAHLPGAIHLPARGLTRARAEATLPPDRPLVLYCADTQ